MGTIVPSTEITNQTGEMMNEGVSWFSQATDMVMSNPLMIIGAILTLVGIVVGIGVGIALLVKKSKY